MIGTLILLFVAIFNANNFLGKNFLRVYLLERKITLFVVTLISKYRQRYYLDVK